MAGSVTTLRNPVTDPLAAPHEPVTSQVMTPIQTIAATVARLIRTEPALTAGIVTTLADGIAQGRNPAALYPLIATIIARHFVTPTAPQK